MRRRIMNHIVGPTHKGGLSRGALVCATLTLALAAQAGAMPIAPVDDTFVRQQADGPHGSEATFNVKNDQGEGVSTRDRIGMLGFDLTGQPDTVTDATLSLDWISGGQLDSNDAAFTVYGIPDGGADEDFDEDTFEYDMFAYGDEPWGTDADGSLKTSGLTSLGTFTTTTESGAIDFSTTALTTFLNADTNNRAALILFRNADHANNTIFASAENTDESLRPTLTLVPEPVSGALTLLALGGLVMLPRRRKVSSC